MQGIQRIYLLLSMQMSENLFTAMELRSDLTDVQQRMANVLDQLGDFVTHSELHEIEGQMVRTPLLSNRLKKEGCKHHSIPWPLYAYTVKTVISGVPLKDYIEERAMEIGEYIIDKKATVRQTARKFGVSKSTVHVVVT